MLVTEKCENPHLSLAGGVSPARVEVFELFFVHQHSAILSAIIDDLVLLDTCSETAEWANQFVYLPLR